MFQLARYYVVAGLCGQGYNLGPGMGQLVAQWISSGDPPMNPVFYDLRRFVHLHNNLNFLRERVTESVGMLEWSPNQPPLLLGTSPSLP